MDMDKMDTIPQTFMSDPVFRRLDNVAKYAALTERDKKAYKESLKVYRDNYAIAETERNEGRAEGLAEGMTKGIAKGRAEGIAEGLVKGRAETLAEKAKQAKEMGLPEDVIARLFGSIN